MLKTINFDMNTEIYSLMHQLKHSQTPFAVATVVETEGSVSAKIGAKAVIDESGKRFAGWIGGGCAESQCQTSAVEAIKQGYGFTVTIDMNDEVLGAGMPCGGSMKVFIEPVLPNPVLWILGHGRIAEALCSIGQTLGYRINVNDPTATSAQFAGADDIINDDFDYESLNPDKNDFVVIATQHKGDHESLQKVLSTQVGYIGLIASHKRANLVFEFLKETGFSEQQIARVKSPCGLDLGAKTPEEIALSILSEITQIRRAGAGFPLSISEQTDVSRHPA